MTQLMILVANGSVARCFGRAGAHEPLVPLETIAFPEGRLQDREVSHDRHGHGSSDNSSAVVHFEPRTSAHRKKMHQFAHTLAKRLDQGATTHEYKDLWVIASNPLMGELKAALSPNVTEKLQLTHQADLTHLDLGALEARLRELRTLAG